MQSKENGVDASILGKPVSRRSFFKTLFKAGVIGSAGGLVYSGAVEPFWFTVKKYTIQSPKWPKAMPPLRIAVAADLHVGCPSVNLKTTEWIVDSLNAMKADCIVLLGDYLISGVKGGKYVPPQLIGEVLSGLRAPMGVYSVLGNHDWWEDGEGMWAALEAAGIKVLENDAQYIEASAGQKFWIAGLADDSTRKPDITGTLEKVKTDDPVIMLSHDPASFLEMTGRPVVTLSGHTHGGQMAIPFWGAVVIPGRAPIKYAYGHIQEQGKDLIVSCGIGTSVLPLRLSRRPELIDLTIISADS